MTKAKFLAENLKPGEHYGGLILGQNGDPDYHLFVLPGEAEKVIWSKAREWAKKVGGELPTRREQSLLLANLKEQFKGVWYWSCEQHAAYSDYAWFQNFSRGSQDGTSVDDKLRARAVRRLAI